MPILSLRNLTLSHGAFPLLENANLIIEPGERVCLIGRNGVGKSSLLALIRGEIVPHSGTVEKSKTLTINGLQQNVPQDLVGSVYDIVKGCTNDDIASWEIDKIIDKLELAPDARFESLSGGLKRRVLLAKALVNDPDLLLLDEPTNHLDITSITWLESFLLKYRKTLIIITHDRELMQSLATHIVEIDKGRLISWRGHYQDYLQHKEHVLAAEETANSLFDKRLSAEEVWIRKGIQARRTRNEGRVRALKSMREEYENRRKHIGNVKLKQHDLASSGKIVFDIEDLSFYYDEKPIVNHFSTVIRRGDKIGIIGANGSGKSTFLNLLFEKIKPSTGNITRGTNLSIAYFDQNRLQLDENKSVIDNVQEGSETVTIGGQSQHIISYLKDFLFSPERARGPVKALSGGERNRIILAKIFMLPCNLLILDEPTNDLDVETLELLEEKLMNYKGTLLLVSHDRTFLNNVITSSLYFEGDGSVKEYVGNYDDFLRQHKTVAPQEPVESVKPEKNKKTKNTHQTKRELAKLYKKIESLEAKQQTLQLQLCEPGFYQSPAETIEQVQSELVAINETLEELYEQWETSEN